VAELNGLGHVAEMAEGAKSQFDVIVDGETIFSKQRSGHFPELKDVLTALPAVAD
jgi:predicted Rdx family selenoprotein